MPGSRSKSRSRSRSRSRSKITQNYKVHTQLMVDFLRQYIIRTSALPRGIEFSKQDIELMSDVKYLNGISESVGFGLSPLEVWVLRVLDRNSNTQEVKELLQIVSVMYGYKLDIDDLVDSLQRLVTPHAEKRRIELIDGGNKRKMLGFAFQFVQLYVIYLMVTCMSKSLEQRTSNSKTANNVVEFMKNSNCEKPELNPLLAWGTGHMSKIEVDILNAALMLGSGEGGCLPNKYQDAVKDTLFAGDNKGEYSDQGEYLSLGQTQKYSSALVLAGPNSVALADLTDNPAAKKIRSMSAKSKVNLFDQYMVLSKSTDQKDFEKQLAQLTDTPSQGSIVNIKEQPTMLGAAAYVLGEIGDQAKMYWSDVRDFGLLNPIPLDDVWRELKQEARRRITLYQRLVEDGRIAMETANDELWAWLKHAGMLFLLTKTGICLGFSLTVSLMKELNSWRKGKPAPFAIEPESRAKSKSKSQLRLTGGKRTRKIKKCGLI